MKGCPVHIRMGMGNMTYFRIIHLFVGGQEALIKRLSCAYTDGHGEHDFFRMVYFISRWSGSGWRSLQGCPAHTRMGMGNMTFSG